MQMYFYYQYFEENNLLIQRFEGEWSTERYESYMDMALKTVDMSSIRKILSDLRKVNLSIVTEDISNLIRIRNKVSNMDYQNIHVVSDPIITANTFLYQEKLKAIGLKYEFCSTISHAIKLLKLDYSVVEMESILSKLKNKY